MRETDFRSEYELAIAAVRAARDVLPSPAEHANIDILDDVGRDVKISTDRESEERILEVLHRGSYYPVLAEESAQHGNRELEEEVLWVVDPLDGSANFLRGIPLSCVAIGLLVRGAPRLGVILDIARERIYSGVVGIGAWMGPVEDPTERIIRPRPTHRRNAAILATGLPVSRDFGRRALSGFLPWFQQFKKVRMFGTAALSLAFVASGVVDAYAEDDIKVWDVAAGIALVEAAGGFVDARPSPTISNALVVRAAGSPQLWAEVQGDNELAPRQESSS